MSMCSFRGLRGTASTCTKYGNMYPQYFQTIVSTLVIDYKRARTVLLPLPPTSSLCSSFCTPIGNVRQGVSKQNKQPPTTKGNRIDIKLEANAVLGLSAEGVRMLRQVVPLRVCLEFALSEIKYLTTPGHKTVNHY